MDRSSIDGNAVPSKSLCMILHCCSEGGSGRELGGRTGLRRTWSLSQGHIMHRCAAVLVLWSGCCWWQRQALQPSW